MEEIELVAPTNSFKYSKGEHHVIYITDYLENFADHINNLEIIRNASESDTITFYINSGGGRADIMISYVTALKSTLAETVGCGEGDVASAATAILFNCKKVIINPHTLLLIHDWSGGTYGKADDMEKYLSNQRNRFKYFLEDTYKGFLSDNELIAVQEGKELYFYDLKDIQQRLLNLQSYKMSIASNNYGVING